MSEIKEITEALISFRDERNWKQFHKPKDLALAISIEAGELNELFLWKKEEEISSIPLERIKEELADVLAYAFLLAENYNVDPKEIILEKIKKNALKYPVEFSKDNARKYNDL